MLCPVQCGAMGARVHNGGLGTVSGIDHEDGVLVAGFDNRAVEYAVAELDMLVPAYAATSHEAGAKPRLYRGHARQVVIVVGQRRALTIVVRTSDARRRCTKPGAPLPA